MGGRRARLWLVAAAGLALACAPRLVLADPAAFPTFPQIGSFDLINQWLAANTTLPARQVVLVSSEAAFAFTDAPPLRAGPTVTR